MKKILCILLVVALLAAVMCVPAFATCVESKGDGYSLFNGVKLPNLPEYDTDKYRYTVFYGNFLLACSEPLFITGNAINSGEKEVSFIRCILSSEEDEWTVVAETTGIISTLVNIQKVSWSNYDILNTADNSVYLAASDPIPLDGMNVIEWDGDTTGLEVFPDSVGCYHVSDVTDVDVSKRCLRRLGSNSVSNISLSAKEGYYSNLSYLRYVETASDTYPTAGVFLKSETDNFISLFAYYPIEAGTAVPENILFLDSIGATLSTGLSMLGSVAQTIATTPLLFVCFTVGFIGLGVALFRRIRK